MLVLRLIRCYSTVQMRATTHVSQAAPVYCVADLLVCLAQAVVSGGEGECQLHLQDLQKSPIQQLRHQSSHLPFDCVAHSVPRKLVMGMVGSPH